MPYTVIDDVVILSEAGSVHYPAGSKIADDVPETAELLAAGKIVPEGQEPVEVAAVEEPRRPYTVVEEFIVSRGDTAVHISDVGSVVELTDAEAAAAGAAVTAEDAPAEGPGDPATTGEAESGPDGESEGESGEDEHDPEGESDEGEDDPDGGSGDEKSHTRRSRRP